MVYVLLACVCISSLVYRRAAYGAELGGPAGSKFVTGVFFTFLWLIYVALSSLKAKALI
jgi:hypothetical protein